MAVEKSYLIKEQEKIRQEKPPLRVIKGGKNDIENSPENDELDKLLTKKPEDTTKGILKILEKPIQQQTERETRARIMENVEKQKADFKKFEEGLKKPTTETAKKIIDDLVKRKTIQDIQNITDEEIDKWADNIRPVDDTPIELTEKDLEFEDEGTESNPIELTSEDLEFEDDEEKITKASADKFFREGDLAYEKQKEENKKIMEAAKQTETEIKNEDALLKRLNKSDKLNLELLRDLSERHDERNYLTFVNVLNGFTDDEKYALMPILTSNAGTNEWVQRWGKASEKNRFIIKQSEMLEKMAPKKQSLWGKVKGFFGR